MLAITKDTLVRPYYIFNCLHSVGGYCLKMSLVVRCVQIKWGMPKKSPTTKRTMEQEQLDVLNLTVVFYIVEQQNELLKWYSKNLIGNLTLLLLQG